MTKSRDFFSNVIKGNLLTCSTYQGTAVLTILESGEHWVDFYQHPHDYKAFAPKPAIQFWETIGYSAGYQFAVDPAEVKTFAEDMRPLIMEIQLGSTFYVDPHNYERVRDLTERAEEAREELRLEFQEFLGRKEWIDVKAMKAAKRRKTAKFKSLMLSLGN